VLAGSSLGGLMAAMYACDNERAIRRLILLAPALNLGDFNPYLNRRIAVPVTLYHGRQDYVVLPGPVRRIAEQVFTALEYHAVDDDHSLGETFPSYDWERLLAD